MNPPSLEPRFPSCCLPALAGVLSLVAPAAFAENPADPWWQQATFEGDLRLRYETIRKEPGDDVERERYRGRFGVSAEHGDALKFGIRVATGEGDPGSTNLNFGESVTSDNVRLDRAYLDWAVGDTFQVTVGKMKNPFFLAGETALIWDGDFNPAGAAASYDAGTFFARAGSFRLDYRDDGVESWLYAAQAGAAFDLPQSSAVTVGAGWLDFTHIAGQAPLYGSNARGNSLDSGGDYRNDYDVVELFAEYRTVLANWPVVAFAAWARNTRAAGEDTAWSVGVNVGKADEPGTAEWSWEWRDTEADALLGVLTDSDLADGNTASRGHVMKAAYRLAGPVSIGATLLFSEYGRNGSSADFDRLMLDIVFEF